MKLLLSGGGSEKDSRLLDELLVDLIPDRKDLLYIPLAMDKSKYKDCYSWMTKTLESLKFGPERIVMWTGLENKEYKDIKNFGAIYIGGGNTFRLLYLLRKTKFDKILIKYAQNNGIIYGGSAGAIILGGDIMTSANTDKNEVNLKNTIGLNLINGYSIWCHYHKDDKNKILNYIKQAKAPVIALREKTGIFVTDNKIKVVGFESLTIFFKNEELTFHPNKSIRFPLRKDGKSKR